MKSSLLSRPVRLAVFLEQEMKLGGGFQQSLNAALETTHLSKELCEPIFITTVKKNIPILLQYGINARLLRLPIGRKTFLWIRSRLQHKLLLTIIRRLFGLNYLDSFLSEQLVDLVYFTTPSVLALYTEKYNYIFTVWDLCHRDEVEFPEVRQDREFERREHLYRKVLPRGTAILADSELGRNNIVRRYGVDEERVHVMRFSASIVTRNHETIDGRRSVDVKSKYELQDDYVYYPAQFWPHKNHIYLIQGLVELEQKFGRKLAAVFSGSDMGNMDYVKSVAVESGIADRIRYVGFVPNSEIPELYKQSVALVMPTYFGPTNLPPLEAFHLKVPVLYSNLPGLAEQVGDAALLMDLSNPGSMALHLNDLLNDQLLRSKLIEKGTERLNEVASNKGLGLIEFIIDSYRTKRQSWG